MNKKKVDGDFPINAFYFNMRPYRKLKARDVAKAAGLSFSTVRHAANGQPISKAARERLMNACPLLLKEYHERIKQEKRTKNENNGTSTF